MDVVTYAAAVGAAKRYTDEHSGSDDAVKYTEQSLTSEQQAQARENIGAAASTDIPTDAVKYTAQTLTAAQKTQARTNIGAGTSSFSGNYSDLTNPPPLLKGNGSGGNLVGGTGAAAMNGTRYANSVAYGYITEAAANYAFAFGENAFAGVYNRNTGKHAVAIGKNVRAEKDYEWAIGKFNQTNSDTAFAYGDGTSDNDRHNLMELKTDGTLLLNGNAVKTEGEDDDNKLRLGQIWNPTNYDSKFPVYGFNGFHSSSFNLAVLIISADEWLDIRDTSGSTLTLYTFGDFAVRFTGSSKPEYTVTIRPLGGRTAGKPTTGAWILVENCFRMFYGCTNSYLVSLDLSIFDTSECRVMTQMFYECTALTTLDISSFDMTNVIAYDKMFGEESHWAGITTLKTPKINPHDDIPLPRTLYSQDGTAYTNLPVTTGTSIELRQSWT